MSYTLLQLVDQCCGELGLSQPSVVVGAGAELTKQLLALTQRLGKDLVREFEWRRLVKAYVLQTTAAVSETGNTTSGSTSVTSIGDTSGMQAGDIVAGTAIPAYAEIASIDSGTALTLTMPATAAGTGITITVKRQDYALPSDYDRMVSDTQWDRTNSWQNMGPKSSQEWQWIHGSLGSNGPWGRFRLYGNKLRFTPAPTAVTNIAFEYVSNLWVLATGGTAPTKSTFTVDTDTCVFPDELMAAGLNYYFKKAKKLDFGVEMAEFADILAQRKGQDSPVESLSLTPRVPSEFIGAVPEGSWDL